jgi:hypothetical protein
MGGLGREQVPWRDIIAKRKHFNSDYPASHLNILKLVQQRSEQ